MHVTCTGKFMKKIYYEKKTSCLREDLAKVQRGYEKEKVLFSFLQLIVYKSFVTVICFVYEIFVNKL